jgi:hypothetical protein
MRFATIPCLLFTVCLAFAAGCSSEPKDPFASWDAAMKYKEFVPATAQTVASGTGVLEYTIPESGILYLMDTTKTVQVEGFTKPTVIITGNVPSGTHVIFDPKQKRIYAKGRTGVRLTEVEAGHNHELRFDKMAQPKK